MGVVSNEADRDDPRVMGVSQVRPSEVAKLVVSPIYAYHSHGTLPGFQDGKS